MTHAYDRTLLASLGFADPDKREADHDLASRYLLKNALKLYNAIFPLGIDSGRPFLWQMWDKSYAVMGEVIRNIKILSATLEAPISKGEGRYKTTVGFLDALFVYSDSLSIEGQRRRIEMPAAEFRPTLSQPEDATSLWLQGEKQEAGLWTVQAGYRRVAVEVKVNRVPLGDLLRQINLYREYAQADRWVIATTFPLKRSERLLLAQQRIQPVRLGDNFQIWAAEEQKEQLGMVEL